MIGGRGTGWIGIDVGSHTVKLVQAERKSGRLELTQALIVRRSEPWPDITPDASLPIESSEEIRAGLALGSEFRGRAAAIALPMSLCDVRTCAVAEGSQQEMRSQVAKELAPVFGNIEATHEFDHWTMELPGDRNTQAENTLAASISHEWAEQVAHDMSSAGLVGKVLDVLPTALARAVELGSPGSSRLPVAAIDWGFRRATLCAVLNGRPHFVRCLRDCGFASTIAALTKGLSISSEEAQKLLTERGLPLRSGQTDDELQSVIEEVITEPLNVLVEELERTIGFLRQQRRALVPTKLVLFGGGAAVNNIAPYLADRLDLPADTWTIHGRAHTETRIPVPLLGPAVALSTLAWSKA
jgi:Tfp pilus assembly PilM family ATPase